MPELFHHGTLTGYAYWRCRCDECKKAKSGYEMKRRLWFKENGVPNIIQHGKASTYRNYACRCMECTVAMAHVMKEYNVRRKANQLKAERAAKARARREARKQNA